MSCELVISIDTNGDVSTHVSGTPFEMETARNGLNEFSPIRKVLEKLILASLSEDKNAVS